MREYTDEIIKKFWERAIKSNDDNDCWQWKGITDKAGLPIITYIVSGDTKSSEFAARRVSLFIDGRLPEDKFVVQQTCMSKECVNPKHLIVSNDERFWSKVDKTTDPNGCWLWTAGKDKDGYGKFKLTDNGKRIDVRAHIYSYQINVGPIPPGQLICHECDNPGCVRFDHLFLGTPQDNSSDMVRKDRQLKGEDKPQHKLTEEEVREIRKFYGIKTNKELSDLYGVTPSNIWKVANYKSWRHVKD